MSSINKNNLEGFFISQQITFKALPQKEKWSLQKKWREVYAKEIQPKNLGSFLWHTFSSKYTKSLESSRALEEFEHLNINNPSDKIYRFYIIPEIAEEYDSLPAYECSCHSLYPNFTETKLDLIIVSKDFDWTMVFTHEQSEHSSLGLGPYFSLAKWHS